MDALMPHFPALVLVSVLFSLRPGLRSPCYMIYIAKGDSCPHFPSAEFQMYSTTPGLFSVGGSSQGRYVAIGLHFQLLPLLEM